MSKAKKIFKKGSTTYFFSSLFFPKEVQDDVATLYAFVRTADDFVDANPQDAEGFEGYYDKSLKALSGKVVDDPIINDFFALSRRKGFRKEWTLAFLQSMAMDLTKNTYESFEELEEYMYGSAEVIGLFMCQLLDLPSESQTAAKLQGKAMQLINFIRDIQEDLDLGRQYLPTEELKKFGLGSLHHDEAFENKDRFVAFIHSQIDRYAYIQSQAEKGYRYIPIRYLVPIQTAADMYSWTAKQIKKDPFRIYKEKMKPSPARIITTSIISFYSTWQSRIISRRSAK